MLFDFLWQTRFGMRQSVKDDGSGRLLLIEDDERFGQVLSSALEGQGFRVEWSRDGLHGLDLARTHSWSVVILDLMIPTTDGASVLRSLRKVSNVPVLVLTAKHSLEQRVGRLEEGADDYMTKPAELPELVARLRALIRRAAGAAGQRLRLADCEIDLYERTVRQNGRKIDLTSTEFRLLEILVRRSGSAVATPEVCNILSSSGDAVTSATVRAHVRNLRAKLGQQLVRTRRGFGYLVPKAT